MKQLSVFKKVNAAWFWAGVAVILFSLFVRVSYEIYELMTGDLKLTRMDEWILVYVSQLRIAKLNGPMVDITALGSATVVTLMTIISLIVMIFMKARSGAIHLALAIVGAAGFGQVVKHLFHRARPDVAGRLIEVSGFSYPSGHSVGASAFYVTLCLLSFQYFRKSHERVTLFMICFGMIFLIGFSRVYLGVHYPSDVFSGICLGAGWALLLQSISSWMDSTN